MEGYNLFLFIFLKRFILIKCQEGTFASLYRKGCRQESHTCIQSVFSILLGWLSLYDNILILFSFSSELFVVVAQP